MSLAGCDVEKLVHEGSADWTGDQIIQMLEDICVRWGIRHWRVRNEPELRELEREVTFAVKAATFTPQQKPRLRTALQKFIAAADCADYANEMVAYLKTL